MDIAELVVAFETGAIAPAEFRHDDHVRVCWGLIRRYGPDEGFARLRSGIRAMALRAGRPEAYHATITRAWFDLIATVNDLETTPELFDKAILGRYYSPTRLAEGRETWVEPDLHPLRLPLLPRASGVVESRTASPHVDARGHDGDPGA